MPDSYQFFASHEAIRTSELLATAIDDARVLASRNPATRMIVTQVAVIAEQWIRELDQIAVQTAAYADERIRQAIRDTAAGRPDTSKTIHLIDLVHSQPDMLGSVHVALLSELDKGVDPNYPGAGPYWRAQEYGKTQDRWLFGVFFGEGSDSGGDAPRAQYKGGGGPGAEFVVGQPDGGWGHFDTPLRARHFLERGSNEAAAYYLRRINAASHQGAQQIDRVIGEVDAFTGRRL